jgi:hypothetical protein
MHVRVGRRLEAVVLVVVAAVLAGQLPRRPCSVLGLLVVLSTAALG